MLNLGTVRPGRTIYIPFDTFAGSTGASITMTGFAVGDIKVYKDGSTTERASTSGYTLLDTDGTDFDGITGIQGFSIDLSDNTTADFWQAGSRYFVAISTITVDSQTVSFVAAHFTIGYEAAVLNTFIATLTNQTSFTLNIGPAEDDALKGHWVAIHDAASAVQYSWAIVSAYTGSTKTVTLAAAPTFTIAAKDNISVMGLAPLQPTVLGRTFDVSSGGEGGVDWANVGSPTTTNNLSGTTVSAVSGAVGSVTGAVGSVTGNVGGNVAGSVGSVASGGISAASIAADAITAAKIADGAIDAATFAAGAINAAAIAADAITDAKVASDVTIASVTGAVGSVTGNVGGNVVGNVNGNVSGSVGSVTGSVGSVTGAVGSVTGNVGGNVVGSTASVTGAVGSVTGDVGGNVSGKVLGGGGGTIAGDGVRAESVTGAVGSVTGAVGSVTGAVGSVTGNVGGNVVGSVASVTAAVTVSSNIKKNQALAGFTFVMVDSSDHVSGKTGLTVTAQRSIDGAAFASCANSVTEISAGAYKIDLAAADLNGNSILLKFSASGADTRFVEIVTQP